MVVLEPRVHRSTIVRRGCTAGRIVSAAIALIVLAGAACTGPRTVKLDIDPDTLDDSQFQAYIADSPLISVAEAYRAMLILADGEDSAKTFEERKAKLESRGIARSEWNLQPDNVIDKGSLAYMVARICKINGGVNLTVFGSLGIGERRYAMRELVYRDMLADAVDYQFVTGGELTALMGKADAYMARKGLYETKKIDIGSEAEFVGPGGGASQHREPTSAEPAQPAPGSAEAQPAESSPPTQTAPPSQAPADAGNSQLEPVP